MPVRFWQTGLTEAQVSRSTKADEQGASQEPVVSQQAVVSKKGGRISKQGRGVGKENVQGQTRDLASDPQRGITVASGDDQRFGSSKVPQAAPTPSPNITQEEPKELKGLKKEKGLQEGRKRKALALLHPARPNRISAPLPSKGQTLPSKKVKRHPRKLEDAKDEEMEVDLGSGEGGRAGLVELEAHFKEIDAFELETEWVL